MIAKNRMRNDRIPETFSSPFDPSPVKIEGHDDIYGLIFCVRLERTQKPTNPLKTKQDTQNALC
jgi:hypothetical protein